MSIIMIVIAVAFAFLIAHERVKIASELYDKRIRMSMLTFEIARNYSESLESVYDVCKHFFHINISETDSEELRKCIIGNFGNECEEYCTLLCSLPTTRSDEIDSIIFKMKEISDELEKGSLDALNGVKGSAYIFYPGIVLILALLTI